MHFVTLGVGIGACWAALRFTRNLGRDRVWIFVAISAIGMVGCTVSYVSLVVALVFLVGSFVAWFSAARPADTTVMTAASKSSQESEHPAKSDR